MLVSSRDETPTSGNDVGSTSASLSARSERPKATTDAAIGTSNVNMARGAVLTSGSSRLAEQGREHSGHQIRRPQAHQDHGRDLLLARQRPPRRWNLSAERDSTRALIWSPLKLQLRDPLGLSKAVKASPDADSSGPRNGPRPRGGLRGRLVGAELLQLVANSGARQQPSVLAGSDELAGRLRNRLLFTRARTGSRDQTWPEQASGLLFRWAASDKLAELDSKAASSGLVLGQLAAPFICPTLALH